MQTAPHSAASGRPPGFIGIGLANDTNEAGLAALLGRLYAQGRIDYYELYLYKDMDQRAHLQALLAELPPEMPLVWHAGGEFELAVPLETHAAYADRFAEIQALLHPLWCLEDIAAITFGSRRKVASKWIPAIPPPLTAQALAVVIERTRSAKAFCPIEFLPEIPYFPVPVGGTMSLSRFMAEVAAQADTDVVFDVGHYMSWNLLHGNPLDCDLEAFPWARVAEIHLGGGFFADAERRIWIDDHSSPIHPVQVALLERIVAGCPRLRGVLLELVDAAHDVLDYSLALLEPAVRRHFPPRRGLP